MKMSCASKVVAAGEPVARGVPDLEVELEHVVSSVDVCCVGMLSLSCCFSLPILVCCRADARLCGSGGEAALEPGALLVEPWPPVCPYTANVAARATSCIVIPSCVYSCESRGGWRWPLAIVVSPRSCERTIKLSLKRRFDSDLRLVIS